MKNKVVGTILIGMLIMSACSFSNSEETEQSLQVASSALVTDYTTETASEMVTAEIHEEENTSEETEVQEYEANIGRDSYEDVIGLSLIHI